MREAVYPYLLRGLSIGRTNFVWALEITVVYGLLSKSFLRSVG